MSWLSEYVDIGEVQGLAADLSKIGLKVESVERPGEGIEDVVVAEVIEVRDHPDAENLILALVTTGSDRYTVVVGARNFAVGDLVPYAKVGAKLPGGLQIERKRLRGVESDGMLCSARELGISEDHSGIFVIPEGEPGADVRDALGLDDVIFDLEIKPNRPDAMSLVGVARDLAALRGSPLREPMATVVEGNEPVSKLTSVTVEDVAGCPRYLARVISGVRVGTSPVAAQRRLALAGYRPISNVVDATNYALVVLGHPLHAFDLDKLQGRRIVVRRAKKGERINTIDGEDRRLDEQDLVIADSKHAVAIAGVMGGAASEVGETTENVLVESAYFDPVSILRTSKRHGLRSEASARFERGMDPNGVAAAADYAAKLIVEWSQGTIASGVIDIYPSPRERIVVSLRAERANLLLGTSLTPRQMSATLVGLGIETSADDGVLTAVVPTRRPDITIAEDLVEEIARMEGYATIPSRLPPGSNRAGSLTREQRLVRRIRALLAGAGLWEAYDSSLLGPADIDKMGYPAGSRGASPLLLVNALIVDESLLRTSLIPGLLNSIGRNVSRRNLSVGLFEIGHVFLSADSVLPEQPRRLGIAIYGAVEQQWHTPQRDTDFFDLKGVVDALLTGLRVDGVTYEATREHPFHPARCAAVSVAGTRIGTIGEISPEIAERYDLTSRVMAAELEIEPIFGAAGEPRVSEVPRFPAVFLDLAMEVPESTPAAAVLATARQAGGPHLEDVRIFDLYRGSQIGEGRKSIALSLRFRRRDRTLTDEESLEARDAMVRAIAGAHGGSVRS